MKKKRTDVASVVRQYFQEITDWRGSDEQYSWEEIAGELQKRTRKSMTGAGLRAAYSVEVARQRSISLAAVQTTTITTEKNPEKTIAETPSPRAIQANQAPATADVKPIERVSEHTQRGRAALHRGNNIDEL